MKRMLSLIAIAFLCTACLERETTHTVYLEPDGSVSWQILESGVRSSEKEPSKAIGEETEYLRAASASAHDLALGLESLGARPATTILRAERPFSLHTQARFPSGAALVTALEAELDGAFDIRIVHEGDETLVEIEPDPDFDWENGEESPALALLLNADEVRVALTTGRFIDATGFDLVGDRMAILRDDEEPALLSLRFTATMDGAP